MQTTQPSLPTPTSPLRSVVELAEERFGDPTQVRQTTTLGLAKTYAQEFGLMDFGTHAETTTMAVVLASCRIQQMQLMFEIQVDIERVMEATDSDYGQAVFKLAQGGGHKKVWREIDVLEERAADYRARLKSRAAELAKRSGDTSP